MHIKILQRFCMDFFYCLANFQKSKWRSGTKTTHSFFAFWDHKSALSEGLFSSFVTDFI